MNYLTISTKIVFIFFISSLAHSQTQEAESQTFSTVSASANQICAIRTSGQLVCNTRAFYSRLLPPDDLPQFEAVTVGDFHACGLTFDGQAVCWGDNDFGQTEAPTTSAFNVIEAGSYHTCGIQFDGTVQCWGKNDNGESTPQFFDSNYIQNPSYTEQDWADPDGHNFIDQPNSFSSLDLNYLGSCGLDTVSIIRCWGVSTSNFRPLTYTDNDATAVDLAIGNDNGNSSISQLALMSDGRTASPLGFTHFTGRYSHIESVRPYHMCALTLEGYVDCHHKYDVEPGTSVQSMMDDINDGEPLHSISSASGHGLCGLTADGNLRCSFIDNSLVAPSSGNEVLAAPQDLNVEIYSATTIELFWSPNAEQVIAPASESIQNRSDLHWLGVYQARISGAEIFRDDELLATTTQFGSFVDDTLEAGQTYHYKVRYVPINSSQDSLFSATISVNTRPSSSTFPSVSGNVISWPNDGWYQVQDQITHREICNGGSSCSVETGTYVVINHSTGERFKDIVVGDDLRNNESIEVNGNTISWPDNGWYQVQDQMTYAEICNGGSSCYVEPGTYLVINHSTSERFNDIEVGNELVDSTNIEVNGNTISWPDNGWYQVQDQTTHREICNGGSSCSVEPGTYVVINHSTGERFNAIAVLLP